MFAATSKHQVAGSVAGGMYIASALAIVCFPGLRLCAAPAHITFKNTPPQIGESAPQYFNFKIEFTDESGVSTEVIRSQKRLVTIEDVAQGVANKARVRFDEAGSRNTTSQKDKPRSRPTQLIEPVTGQTYIVSRNEAGLSVVYENGETPGELESAYVLRTLATFGLPNPLAVFLHGRKVKIGESLQLPAKAAIGLMGLDNAEGAKAKCQLKLSKLASKEERMEAVFEMELEARQADGMLTHLAGTLRLDPATCRVIHLDAKGPFELPEIAAGADTPGAAALKGDMHVEGGIDEAHSKTDGK